MLLIVIIIIGAGLRLYGLDQQSLWNDELSGWRYSQVDDLSLVLEKNIPRDHPPGYQVILYFWIHQVGDSEYLLRLPFAIAGILAIVATFFLGRKLYANDVGLIAALMTAVFWAPLYYSQEARAYSMVFLFTLLSVYWLLDIHGALKREERLPVTAVVGYIISAALLSYLHYFGLFFVLLQAALMGMLFLLKRAAWPQLLFVYGMICLLYLPWASRGVNALLTAGPSWTNPPKLKHIFGYFQFLFNQSVWLTLLVFALWGFLVVKGLWSLWRQPGQFRKRIFSADGLLLIWLFVPLGIVFVKSLVSAPAFVNRSLIICLPAAYLLLARALTLLPYGCVTTPAATVLLVSLFSFQLFWLEDYYNRPVKEQFRESVAFVIEHEDSYPGAFIMSFTWDKIYLDYYFERLGSHRRVELDAGLAEDITEAARALQSDPTLYFWYIAAHRDPEEDFLAFLESEYDLLLHEPFIDVDVWLYGKE